MELFLLCVVSVFPAIAVAVMLFRKWVLYVPPNHVVVVTSINNQASVRGQGYHLVKWPFEIVVENNWSYRSVNALKKPMTVRYNSRYIPTQAITMDTPSYRVTDREGVTVEVDVAFSFVINDPAMAVSRYQNLYGFLESCVEGATSYVMNTMHYRDAIGRCADIASQMNRNIAAQLVDSGCVIRTLLVQNVSLDEKLSKTAEMQSIEAQRAQIEQSKLEQEVRIAQQRLENEERLALAAHDHQVAASQRQQWLARQKADNDLELARRNFEIARVNAEQRSLKQDTDARVARLEQETRLAYIEQLVKQGFSSADIVELINGVEIAKHMAVGLGGASKMVMSPEHYRQMLTLPWLPAPKEQ